MSQRPNIYHPDFFQGGPAFFDVSVCNTLSLSIISHASVSAGAAAAAGEALKDKCHEDNVIAAGGLVILSFDCGNIWNLNGVLLLLNILKMIAARNIAKSGLPTVGMPLEIQFQDCPLLLGSSSSCGGR